MVLLTELPRNSRTGDACKVQVEYTAVQALRELRTPIEPVEAFGVVRIPQLPLGSGPSRRQPVAKVEGDIRQGVLLDWAHESLADS